MSEGKGGSPAATKAQASAPRSIPARVSKRPGGAAGSFGRSPHSFSLEDENHFSRLSVSPGDLATGTAVDLESFHVGQLWRDTGIALVGNGDFSIRLHCQRQSSVSNDEAELVLRVGRGGALHVLEEGHCIIGLVAQRHVTKKNKAYLVPDHCMCLVRDPKPVLISCGVAALRRTSSGANEIVLKRGCNSGAFVAVKQRLHVFLSSLASHGRAKVTVDELTASIGLWCDFELDLVSDMSETSMRCLFGSGSKQQLFRESWSSLFATQPPNLSILQDLQERAEREQASRRGGKGKTSEDQIRPWTLPKGNFSHVGSGPFEKPTECAARELKAETGMEWPASQLGQALYVDVLRPDSPLAMERFFLWRDDALVTPNTGEATGDKQWRWFTFEEAAKRSQTAKRLLESDQVQKAMKNS